MKRFLLSSFASLFSFIVLGQQFSNLPYELYWHRYVLEFNDSTILKNSIKSVTAKTESQNKKKKNSKVLYKINFNSQGLPINYTYQKEFGLRNDYRYNPFWRMLNKYPVYDIWTYELQYDNQYRLIIIRETKSMTNSKIKFQEELIFGYDSLGRVNQQTTQQINYQFPQYPFNKDKYVIKYSAYTIEKIMHYKDSSLIDSTIFPESNRVLLDKFNFGDTTEVFMRNIPSDKNSSLFDAMDKQSKVERDLKGLRTKKIRNIKTNDIVNEKVNIGIIYEYEYYK